MVSNLYQPPFILTQAPSSYALLLTWLSVLDLGSEVPLLLLYASNLFLPVTGSDFIPDSAISPQPGTLLLVAECFLFPCNSVQEFSF